MRVFFLQVFNLKKICFSPVPAASPPHNLSIDVWNASRKEGIQNQYLGRTIIPVRDITQQPVHAW